VETREKKASLCIGTFVRRRHMACETIPNGDGGGSMYDATSGPWMEPAMRRVLVVDGDPQSREHLLRFLRSLRVLATGFATAESALAWIENNGAPSLICVDMRLPVMSGFRFCAAVRKNSRACNVPLLAVSSRTEMQDEAQALEAGVDVFLEKPVAHGAFLVAARELLTARGPIPGVEALTATR